MHLPQLLLLAVLLLPTATPATTSSDGLCLLQTAARLRRAQRGVVLSNNVPRFWLVTAFVVLGLVVLALVALSCRFGCKLAAAGVQLLTLLIAAMVVVALWYLWGELVYFLVRQFDVAFIGLPVSVEAVTFNPFNGNFHAKEIALANPAGFASESLLKVQGLSFTVDAFGWVKSFFRHVSVDKVVVEHVVVTYELSLSLRNSNVNDVLGMLHDDLPSTGGGSSSRLSVREVSVKDIWVKATATLLIGAGVRLSAGDLHFEEFTKEMGSMRTGGVVTIVLKAILHAALDAIGKI